MENTTWNWFIAQDLIENIKKIEDLLEMHIKGKGSNLIIYQYQEMKNKMVAELNAVIGSYVNVSIRPKNKRTGLKKKKTAQIAE
jgi:hypothetical protein